ncbi:MAG TPA: hypothetical protein VFD92_07990 [Candidatus Binatia bacterium]|nr:hypothetical protein [Candidatus Binatia bacterium]
MARGALLVVAAMAVTVLRQPAYVLEPGFFGEEGMAYFFRAWHEPWYRVLFIAPAGYFLFFTNVAALAAARLVPLEAAPAVTTLFAFAAQMAPVAIVAFGAAPEWRRPARQAVAIAILLFASLSDEIWLNTINSQCWFAVLAALILLEPADLGRARLRTYACLLALAGLSGPVAAGLAPLFALKAWLARSRAARVLAAIACACLLVQIATVAATHGGRYVGRRGSGASVATLAAIVWMRTIVLPTAGADAATGFARAFVAWTGDDVAGPRAVAAGIALLAAAVAALAWLARPLDARQRIALAGGYATMTAIVALLASGPQRSFLGHAGYSSRYFYAPGTMLLFLLLANADLSRGRRPSARNVACAVLVAIGIATGAARFRESTRWRPDWPRWRDEVALWRADPARSLRTWPPGWRIFYLVPRTPPSAGSGKAR